MKDNYTESMKSVFENKTSSLKWVFCREEMESDLEEARCAPQDRVKFTSFYEKCEVLNIKPDVLMANPTLLHQFPTRDEMIGRLLDAFYSLYKKAAGPDQYMERIVRRLAPEYRDDTVRTAILKKFIIGSEKKCKSIPTNAVYKWVLDNKMPEDEIKEYNRQNSEDKAKMIAGYLDDSVFSEEALRAPSSGKWKLVQICNNLAAGKFITNGGKTRVYLYYFAFMFDMTVRIRDTDIFDEQKDLEKNLFQDYYNDNLMRYFTEEYQQGEASGFEPEPTGEGINYKNFAEVIYLYYLYRKDLRREDAEGGGALRPWERINRSEDMIRECAEKSAQPGFAEYAARYRIPPEEKFTEIYRERFREQLLDLPEKDLPEMILRYYDMPDPGTAKNKQKILVANESATAYDMVGEIMEEMEEEQSDAFWRGQRLLGEISRIRRLEKKGRELSPDDEDNLSLFEEETAYLESAGFEGRLLALLQKKYAGDKDFMQLAEQLDARITAEIEWSGENENRLLIYLLTVLQAETAGGSPMRLQMIRERIGKVYPSANGLMINKAAETLAAVGFDVKRTADPVNHHSFYELGTRRYEDEDLNSLLQQTRFVLRPDRMASLEKENAIMQLMDRVVKEKIPVNKRISRSRLIILTAQYYVNVLLRDTPDLYSFPDIREDLSDIMDQYLENARYQKFSEKNILDMYVLLSVYLYVIEHDD